MKKILFFIAFTVISVMAFSQIRISQVYGAGGNAGASYTRDFIEIFNAGVTAVDISGWSVQYASSAGTTWAVTAIPAMTPSLGAGKYFLIAQASGGAVGATLPTPDVTGGTSMSASAGKIALVSVNTVLTGTCPTGSTIIDFYGYSSATNTANCSENTPFLSTGITNTQSMFRKTAGCTDAGNNSSDFELMAFSATVVPRNTSTAANLCGGGAALNVAPGAVTGLTANSGSASNESSYSLSGTGLTGTPGNIIVTPSVNIEISTTPGGPYTSTATSPSFISVPYSSATLAATTIYVRIASTATLGTFTGTVTNSGGGATAAVVTVSGSVLDTEPATQATNIIFPATTNTSLTINWTNGSGTGRIVVLRATTATEVPPTDGTVYTATTSPSSNTTGSGNYVVFANSGSGPVTVTGLTPGTSYTVRVYEYNGTGGAQNYYTATATGNPASATTAGTFPNLVPSNFTGISVPLHMAANTGRLPAMFYATVNGLLPNTAYRYFTAGTLTTDIGTTSAAGISILIDYNNGNTFYYLSTASLGGTAGSYGTFTTNASGSFSGSFGLTPSSNAKFNVGNMIFPSISLGVDNGTTTVIENRFQLDLGITVLGYGTTAADGTFLKGMSSATPKNLVGVWKSADGTARVAAIARPLSMTVAENTGITGSGNFATAVIAGYDFAAGSWNTIIPNTLPEGVRLIQQINFVTGAIAGCSTDADGVWGGVNTVNPTTGTTPIQISAANAPLTGTSCFAVLPVTLMDFAAKRVNEKVVLTWSTSQEINSNSFDVQRSADGVNWKTLQTISAAGNSSVAKYYRAGDMSPINGKNLYRLSVNDANGRKTLSEIRTVLFSDKLVVSVSPNPVTDVINVNFSNTGNEKTVLTLINATGAPVKSFTTSASQYTISATGLSKGVYILKVSSQNVNAVQKIVIQ